MKCFAIPLSEEDDMSEPLKEYETARDHLLTGFGFWVDLGAQGLSEDARKVLDETVNRAHEVLDAAVERLIASGAQRACRGPASHYSEPEERALKIAQALMQDES